MASKLPLGNRPPASSSDEDNDEEEYSEEEVEQQQDVEEEEEEDAEVEEEEESLAKEPAATSQASESEDESGSGMDSDETLPSPTASAFTIKPIADKPVEDSVKPKKRAPAPSTPTSTKMSKRPAETPISPEPSKKRNASTSAGGSSEDKKKAGSVHRVWSDEDVIRVLEGLIEFQSEKEADPSIDFYDFIKDSISFGVSKTQLNDKINSLKRKYLNNARKGQDGEDPVFSKPHDHKSFQLSKTVWGAVESDGTDHKKSKNGVKEERSLEELMAAKLRANADEFWGAYPSLKKSIELMPQSLRGFMKDSMGLVRRSKVKELDDKWRKLNKEEFEVYLTRTKLFLDTSQASGFRV